MATSSHETLNFDNITGGRDPPANNYTFLTNSLTISTQLAYPFGTWISSKWNDTDTSDVITDNTTKAYIYAKDLPVETFSVNKDIVDVRSIITVNGTNLLANKSVAISLDKLTLLNFTADTNGLFSLDITISGGLYKNNAILQAIDEAGKSDALYIDILLPSSLSDEIESSKEKTASDNLFFIITITGITIGGILTVIGIIGYKKKHRKTNIMSN